MDAELLTCPIRNLPYARPIRHCELNDDGQPTPDIIETRRRSDLITPVPTPKMRRCRKGKDRIQFTFEDDHGLSSAGRGCTPTPVISEVHGFVANRCALPKADQWLVTPETARLLQTWRYQQFQGFRLFFCQVKAVVMAICPAEVAPKSIAQFKRANAQPEPERFRIALKLVTGAGKTTVIACDADLLCKAINAVRPRSRVPKVKTDRKI